MRLAETALCYNITAAGTNNCRWGQDLGQRRIKKNPLNIDGFGELASLLLNYRIQDETRVSAKFGKGTRINKPLNTYSDDQTIIASDIKKIQVNGKLVSGISLVIFITREINTLDSNGNPNINLMRGNIRWCKDLTLDGVSVNKKCFEQIGIELGVGANGSWKADYFEMADDDTLNIICFPVSSSPVNYVDTADRDNKLAILRESYLGTHTNINKNVIYLGAPGTGKSTLAINDAKKTAISNYIIRTTFHPASDYSSFVGTYKPVKKSGPSSIVIVNPYKEPISNRPETQQVQSSNNVILSNKEWAPIDAPLFTTAINPTNGPIETSHIEYEFEPQAFLKAYMLAMDVDDNVVLIIEEINRANCAQVFGDIFQLLDRNSNYEICPNTAIVTYLKNKGLENHGDESYYFSSDEKINLPDNLYLFATMNTSDQSLFPMDSAFIRRWQRQYVKIDYEADVKDSSSTIIGKLKDVEIEYKDSSLIASDKLASAKVNWADFLKAVNWHISKASQSEDKMLGEFFVKMPDASGKLIISEEVFVNTVMSYLWDEVCKDLPPKNPNRFFKIYKDKDNAINFNYSDYFYCKNDAEKSLLVAKFIFYILQKEKEDKTAEVMDVLKAISTLPGVPASSPSGTSATSTPSNQSPATSPANITAAPSQSSQSPAAAPTSAPAASTQSSQSPDMATTIGSPEPTQE